MSAEPAAPAYRRSVWGSLARRIDPFLDPVLGMVAAGLALMRLLTTDMDALDQRLHEPNLLAVVATVVAAGSLAWRRRRPVAVVRRVRGWCVGGERVVPLHRAAVPADAGQPLLARHPRDPKTGVLGLGAGIVCFAGLGLAGVPDLKAKDLLLAVALLVAAWAVGEAVRSRRELQRDHVRAAVTEERLRIARELHDVVAHSMSLIAVQAGVGAHVIRTDPAAAEQSLDVIADTSRRALEQTRSMLGMLREETEDGTRPPTQGLDDLPALVYDVRAAGLAVELAQSGTRRDSMRRSRWRRTGSCRSR